MMPAPTRTTSACEPVWLSTMPATPPFTPTLLSLGLSVPLERNMRPLLEHDIKPAPRLVVDQLPRMPTARGVLRQQDIPGRQPKVLIAARHEIERAAQRHHQLADRRVMPFEMAAGRRLLERSREHRQFAAQQIAARSRHQVDSAFLEMGIAVVSGPQSNAADHPRS